MVVWPLWFCPTAVVNHFTRGLHTCVSYLSRQKWLAYQIIMSQNPTYETDQERDVPYHNDNMASYRQATTGGAPPQNDGKSYRYATEAIPEDNEDRYPDAADAAYVNAENGQKPSKTSAKAGSGGGSGGGGGFMGQYTTQILVGLVVLFAILWIIFLALFISKSVDSSNAGAGSAGQTGAVKDTTTPVSTSPTTAAPMVKVDRRVVGMYNGKQVTSFTLTNPNNYKVELLNLGARVNKLITPKGVDIVLGFATDNINASYIDAIAGSKFGAANGRICSKIFTPFTFNNQQVSIADASIEGAVNGLYKVIYDSENIGNGIRFSTNADSSVDGVPGSARVDVTYSLDADNNLIVRMTATSTDGTLVDMCNSLRFNLAGGTEAVSNTHKVRVASDSRLLPTGLEATSLGSAYNLSELTTVSVMQTRLETNLGSSEIDVVYSVPGATGWRYIAELATISESITVKMFTNQPYLRLYVDDSINGIQGKASAPYEKLYGISLLAHNLPESTKSVTTQKRIRLEGSSTYISETIYKIDEK